MDCRTCTQWYDDFLDMDPDKPERPGLFYGCRVLGLIADFRHMRDCPHYQEAAEPLAPCTTCGTPVPRACILLGECVNCTDTDLFCLERCTGGEWRRLCNHWVRLSTEGHARVEDDTVRREFPRRSEPGDTRRRRPLKRIFSDHLQQRKQSTNSRKRG